MKSQIKLFKGVTTETILVEYPLKGVGEFTNNGVEIESIYIKNTDTANTATVNIYIYVGADKYTLKTVSLAASAYENDILEQIVANNSKVTIESDYAVDVIVSIKA